MMVYAHSSYLLQQLITIREQLRLKLEHSYQMDYEILKIIKS